MFMSIFLYGTHLFMVATLAFTYRLYAKPNKNVIMETTLPDQYLTDPKVISLTTNYKKQLNQLCLALILLGLPLTFIRYDSIAILYFLFLMIVAFAGVYYLLITTIRTMQLLKQTEKWDALTNSEKTVRVDTALTQSKNQKIIPLWWSLPAILVQVGLLIVGLSVKLDWQFTWLLASISLFVSLIFLLIYRVIYRLPAKVLTADPAINRYCNDLTKRHWSLIMTGSLYFVALIQGTTFLAGFLSATTFFWLSWLVILASLLLLGGTFYLLIDLRRKQNQALDQSQTYYYADADRYWRYGVYINPDDSRLLTPDRIGLNLALNLGHKQAKSLIAGICIPILLLLVILSTMMLQADFSKHTFAMTFSKEKVTLKAPFAQTAELPYTIITDVQLIDEQPPANRIKGASTTTYATGQYKVLTEKNPAEFYIDKHSKKIIKLSTKEKNYYFTSRTTADTLKKYKELKTKLN